MVLSFSTSTSSTSTSTNNNKKKKLKTGGPSSTSRSRTRWSGPCSKHSSFPFCFRLEKKTCSVNFSFSKKFQEKRRCCFFAHHSPPLFLRLSFSPLLLIPFIYFFDFLLLFYFLHKKESPRKETEKNWIGENGAAIFDFSLVSLSPSRDFHLALFRLSLSFSLSLSLFSLNAGQRFKKTPKKYYSRGKTNANPPL